MKRICYVLGWTHESSYTWSYKRALRSISKSSKRECLEVLEIDDSELIR